MKIPFSWKQTESFVRVPIFLALMVALQASRAADATDAADDPESERATFTVAEGFDVNLFASEKEGVIKPIQIRFDARGRLWVIGSTVYPLVEPGQVPNDKVLILEDRDGDGRADKTTVFADGLMIPTGLELFDGGAYVGHGTELLYLKDTNGDGKADERRVVLRGFGTGDNHQNINSFRWGPGGELWMCQGLHIHSNVETPSGIVRLNQAGLWRFRPRLMRLEGFYGSEYEPQNPWGYVFTDWGEPIVLAGNNSSPIYPVPGLVSQHRAEAPTLIWKNGRGRKVSGGEIVGTAHFPESWQGALILGGYINNAVWSLKIIDDGAGFRLEDLPPLIVSSSRSFRPVDVRFGPDGALYLCDWYNPIIGHYQASFRDPGRDKSHGRIWRITARGRPLQKRPDLAQAPVGELLGYLSSNERWVRQFSKRVLAERPSSDVTRGLKQWLTRGELSDRTLVEALGVYQSHEVIAPDLLSRVAKAASPGARAYAAGVIGLWADRLPDALGRLRPLVSDSDARVRLQAVVACSYVPEARAMEVAAMAADRPTDPFLEYGLKQTVFALKPWWLPAFKAGKLDLENKPARLSLLVRADATRDVIEAVRGLAKAGPSSAETAEAFWKILIQHGDREDLANLLKLSDPGLQARLLDGIQSTPQAREKSPAGDLAAMLRPLVTSRTPELSHAALRLAGLWRVEEFRSLAETKAMDGGSAAPDRLSAIEAIRGFAGGQGISVLSNLATNRTRVAAAAIAALSGLNLELAAGRAADWLCGGGSGPAADEAAGTAEIFSAFLKRKGGAPVLARSLEGRTVPKTVAVLGLQTMSAGGGQDSSLTRLLARAAGHEAALGTMGPAAMDRFVAEVRSTGDTGRGAQIFRRAEIGCMACHKINGDGGSVGPDLSALGTAQPIDFIVGAILDPQKEVKEGFASVRVTTQDGEEYQGRITREAVDEVVLQDVARGSEVRLKPKEIRERVNIGSVMPSGLADSLSREEFRDLVRYLSDLGKTR